MKGKSKKMRADPPKGTKSREEPVAPSFPNSPRGKIELWSAKGELYVKMPGVDSQDVINMGTVGIPNPWDSVKPNILFELDSAGLFMNALHVHHERIKAEQERAQQEPAT